MERLQNSCWKKNLTRLIKAPQKKQEMMIWKTKSRRMAKLKIMDIFEPNVLPMLSKWWENWIAGARDDARGKITAVVSHYMLTLRNLIGAAGSSRRADTTRTSVRDSVGSPLINTYDQPTMQQYKLYCTQWMLQYQRFVVLQTNSVLSVCYTLIQRIILFIRSTRIW